MRKLLLSTAFALPALQAQALLMKEEIKVENGRLDIAIQDSSRYYMSIGGQEMHQLGFIKAYRTNPTNTDEDVYNGAIYYQIPLKKEQSGRRSCKLRLSFAAGLEQSEIDKDISKAMLSKALQNMINEGCATITTNHNPHKSPHFHLAFLKNAGFEIEKPSLFKRLMKSVGLPKGSVVKLTRTLEK